ncbi:uncharacterized protein LOC110900589 [Helianthus annuus]|uniref:uncharacterized protein LOC110900589 n=1 Tax=Helianthus annuus TaxID=4232 RepID=UPI000B908ECD|nr:uncharacterized protein LOC110900589 [Helianthus annuus]
MVSLASWNIRGLNRPLKQMEVRQIVKDSNLSLCAILESHVGIDKLGKVCKSVFRSWDWTSNGACCNKGTRIIVGWNPGIFDVMVLFQSSQVMHLQIYFKLDRRIIFCSIVYAANYYVTRRELWRHLTMHKAAVGNNPWVIFGDFNSALNMEDNSMGSSSVSVGMKEFRDCVDSMEMFDINKSGLHFTWSQKPKEGTGLLKKIDRILGNTPFVTAYPNSVAIFHPYRISDHCPCILKIPEAGKLVDGVFQFQVVKRLRLLKSPFRALLYKQGNLHKKVEALRASLDIIQQRIDLDPFNSDLRAEEAGLNRDFQAAALDEERFLKQKSKVDWLTAGDMNSAYFHSSLKVRNHYSRIDIITDSQGVVHENDAVPHAFVSHYENFLGSQGDILLEFPCNF